MSLCIMDPRLLSTWAVHFAVLRLHSPYAPKWYLFNHRDEKSDLPQFFIESVLETTWELVESLKCKSVIL